MKKENQQRRPRLASRVAKLSILSLACIGGVTSQISAQTFNQIKSFGPLTLDPSTGFSTNAEGAYPQADLISSGEALVGVAAQGGEAGNGTIFKINADGSGFAALKAFSAAATNAFGIYTNSDGANPQARLLLSGETFYGTAVNGGKAGMGTVFKINTNGTGFTVLRTFLGGTLDGANPVGGVVVPGDTVFGTTASDGARSGGTIFKVGTNGTGYATIHTFDLSTNNGYLPYGTLLRSGDFLYGTTRSGGAFSAGTVFKINTNGNSFTNRENTKPKSMVKNKLASAAITLNCE